MFPGEVRRLLEHTLVQVDKLTSLNHYQDRHELARYILDVLGIVGDETTISLLTDYVDDPRLEPHALHSIKSLRATQSGR